MASNPIPNYPKQVMNPADADDFRVSALTGLNYLYLTTSGGQNLVKSGTGILHSIVLGNPLTSAVQIWDNIVSGGTTIAKFNANTSAQDFVFDAKFSTGLIVSAGSVADNITLVYL